MHLSDKDILVENNCYVIIICLLFFSIGCTDKHKV